jgi:hypothetical protein
MKLNNLNLGRSLSKDEQKRIKGGTPYCNVGGYAYCACPTGNICVLYTGGDQCGDGTSVGACCQFVCHSGPVLGHYECYTAATCPAGGGDA